MVRTQTKRQTLKQSAGLFVAAVSMSSPVLARQPAQLRVGAIRWDAWYAPDEAPNSGSWYAAHDLDPKEFHNRAPFFARELAPNRLTLVGTQSDMDKEIVYASRAHVNYWAFGWYPNGPIRKGWDLYQSSAKRDLIDWCIIIGLNSLAQHFPPHDDLISYFKQPHYESVDGRPLLYVMHNKWDLEAAKTTLAALRSACVSAGVKNPFIVVQSPAAQLSLSEMRGIGGDAISAYASAPAFSGPPKPYSALDKSVRSFWLSMAETGAPVIPIGMTGWDRRPRIQTPPPFDTSVQHKDGQLIGYFEPATPAELRDHLAALVSFTKSRPEVCSPQHVIIYSWNECDEGGGVLCPTWSPNGPDTSRLDALASVLS